VHIVQRDDTLFLMTMHPTDRGVTTEYFVQVGGIVRGLLQERG
jgi:hypothetical protein